MSNIFTAHKHNLITWILYGYSLKPLKRRGLLYVRLPPDLTFSTYTFCRQIVFVCSVQISEQAVIISLHGIKLTGLCNGERVCLLSGTNPVFECISHLFYLQVRVVLTATTNGRSLGTLKKQWFFENMRAMDRKYSVNRI